MITSVQVSIEDIMPLVKRLVGEGATDTLIMQLVRDEHGVGYGGMVARAIARCKSERFDVV